MDTENNKKPLYIIAGPTSVGKSALGIALAKRLNGEIISADSMQVYKYMDIGTAKVTPEQMEGIPHHLIDILLPTQPFHVAEFKELATKALEEIYNRGKTPIVVGGTGFYIQALLYDIDFSHAGENNSLRAELDKLAKSNGPEALHGLLCELDPKSAKELHPNNVKRIIRAIEFAKQTGQRLSEHNEIQQQKQSPYDFRYYVLNDDRAKLYGRIDNRVDLMIKEGLVDEVKGLIAMGCTGDMTSMQGIGYKQLIRYLEGEYDLDEAIRLIKRDSRHYAKRQLTWSNRENELVWIDRREYPDTRAQLEYIIGNTKKDINK